MNHTLEPSSPAATYLETDPNNLAASLDADTAGYSKIQKKAADLISNAAHISSVYLSFTNWDAIGGIDTINWIRTTNYQQIVDIYPPFWPALRHNVIWLVCLAALAAGAMIVALPTLLVFALLQRHFISGLTLGATKG